MNKLKIFNKIVLAVLFVIIAGGFVNVQKSHAAYLNITGFETGDTIETSGTTGTASIQGTNKRTGSYGLQVTLASSTNNVFIKAIAADGIATNIARTAQTFYTFYFKIVADAAGTTQFLASIEDNAGNNVMDILYGGAGQLNVYSSTYGYGGGVNGVNDGLWHRLDIRVTSNSTVGMSLDGGTEVTGTANNFTQDRLVLGSAGTLSGAGATIAFDDVAISNSANPSAGQVNILKPITHEYYTSWTNGAGTAPTNVADTPNDGDTSYLTSFATNAGSSFEMQTAATGGTLSTIKSVKAIVIARDIGGTAPLQVAQIHRWSGTAVWATLTEPTTTYSPVSLIRDVDPQGNAWAIGDITTGLNGIRVAVRAGTVSVAQRATAFYAMVWSSPSAPTISTPTKTSITTTTAVLGGNVTSDGGATITGRGVCVGTSADPAIGGTCFTTTGTTGVFTVNATGLTVNTLYHYRAYATNSTSTSYTTDDTFTTVSIPTLTLPTKTTPTDTTITLGATVSSDNGAAVTSRGVCYAKTSDDATPGFTTATGSTPETNVTCTTTAGTTGLFTVPITSLLPITAYTYRGFARNSVGNGYSTVDSFTTYGPPSTTTSAASGHTTTSAILNSTINPNGASTNVYYLWGTTSQTCSAYTSQLSGPTALTGTANLSGATTQSTLSSLSPNQTYYFCVMATNTYGTNYGTVLNFTTSATPGAYTYMDAGSALGGGATDCLDTSAAPCPPTTPSVGSPTQTSLSISWSAGTGPTQTSYNLQWCSGAACTPSTTITGVTSAYSHTGRTCNTLYRYRIIAVNALGSSTASGIGEATTSSCASAPSVTTSAASSITGSTAILNSTINPNGASTTITYRYQAGNTSTCNSGTPTSTISGPSGLTGNNPLSGATTQQSLTGLLESTQYSFCATASNGIVGQQYGSPALQFTTTKTFYDTFTDTDGVAISSHTPDVGSGWTQLVTAGSAPGNTIVINTNRARPGASTASTGSIYRTNSGAGDADYKVMGTLAVGSTSDDYVILAGRVADANNMYAVEFNNTQTRLYKRVAGTWTQMANTGAGIATGSIVTLNMNGTNIAALDDGIVVVEVNDSSLSAAGYGGIGFGGAINSGGDTTTHALDAFEISDTPIACTSSRYVDQDNDNYGLLGSTIGCFIDGSTVATDCMDTNATVNPAQSSYFTTNRGDGSYDYNCNSSEERDPGIYNNGTAYTYSPGQCYGLLCGRYYRNPYATCNGADVGCSGGAASVQDNAVTGNVTSSTACGSGVAYVAYTDSNCTQDAGIYACSNYGAFYLGCK